MVRVRDEGVFDAPIDRIWKYLNDAPSHQHSITKLGPVLEQKGNAIKIAGQVKNPDGTWRKETYVMTMNPPTSFTLETVDGPMKGTKHTHTYTPQGNHTKVVVEGDFVNPGMDDAATRKAVLSYFETMFNEDNATLRKYK